MSNELTQLGLCDFPQEKLKLLKDTVCKGATDNELQLFLHVCIKTGLDPFMKQIYSIRRRSKDKFGNWIESQTIQTSIDGFRLIAERTKKYSPGKECTYCYDEKNNLISATSYIKKMTIDGTWHDVSATCFLSEYKPSNASFWDRMPHVMLAKCAETAALRKAFPAEMSGVYSDDEMAQAKNSEEIKIEDVKIIQINEEEILLQNEKKKEIFNNYAQFFDEQDKELIVEYLFAYSDRWNKSAEETTERFKDDKEFLQYFNVWKSKKVSK